MRGTPGGEPHMPYQIPNIPYQIWNSKKIVKKIISWYNMKVICLTKH